MIYDAAGRSQDAFSLTWDSIEFRSRGGGIQKLKKGKTGKRPAIFSPRTEKLLEEHKKSTSDSNKVFPQFDVLHTMRTWLNEQIKRITLPKESAIDTNHFQVHNLRVSKVTWMSQHEGKTDAELMSYVGWTDIRNLHVYIKVDPDKQLNELLDEEQRKDAERTK